MATAKKTTRKKATKKKVAKKATRKKATKKAAKKVAKKATKKKATKKAAKKVAKKATKKKATKKKAAKKATKKVAKKATKKKATKKLLRKRQLVKQLQRRQLLVRRSNFDLQRSLLKPRVTHGVFYCLKFLNLNVVRVYQACQHMIFPLTINTKVLSRLTFDLKSQFFQDPTAGFVRRHIICLNSMKF